MIYRGNALAIGRPGDDGLAPAAAIATADPDLAAVQAEGLPGGLTVTLRIQRRRGTRQRTA